MCVQGEGEVPPLPEMLPPLPARSSAWLQPEPCPPPPAPRLCQVIRELSRNKWMDPKQAIEYGMIDKILTTPVPKIPNTGPRFKFERTKEDLESAGL